MLKFLFIISFFTFYSAPAWGEDNPSVIKIDPIIVSGNRYPQKKQQATQTIDVITREELAQEEDHSLTYVLQKKAGLQVIQLGTPGEDVDIRLRGSDRDEVLIMINHNPINNLIDGRTLILNTIPIELIEKIEIIRGASSVLYGSHAAGGIINIITKQAQEEPEYGISFYAGNLGIFKESIFGSTQIDSKYSLSAAYSRHDQRGRFDNQDRFGSHSLFLSSGIDMGEHSHLQAELIFLKMDQELAFDSVSAGGVPIPIWVVRDQNRELVKTTFLPQIWFESKPSSFYEFRLSYSFYAQEQKLSNSNQGETLPDPGLTANSQEFTSSASRHHFDFWNRFKLWDKKNLKNSLLVGASFDLEKLNYTDAPFPGDTTTRGTTTFPNEALGQEGTRRNLGVYIQDSLNIKDRFFLNVGLRVDTNNTYGESISPRISTSYYLPRTKTKLLATYSQGFKAPTVNQYYLTLTDGTGIQLRQNLTEEKSQTFEVGFEQKIAKQLKFSFTYFHTDYETMIDNLELIEDALIHGLEARLFFQPLDWLKLYGNYTYTYAINSALN